MKSNEILELVRAGYTKEEIDKMDDAGATPVKEEAAIPGGESLDVGDEEEPAGARSSSSTPAEEHNNELKAWIEDIHKKNEAQIEELKKLIQTKNAKTFDVGQTDEEIVKSAVDVMNEVYNKAAYIHKDE